MASNGTTPEHDGQFIDLDELLPADFLFTIGGHPWRVPGDLPVPLVLGLVETAQQMEAMTGLDEPTTADSDRSSQLMDQLHSQVVHLFTLREQEADVADLQLGPAALMQIVRIVLEGMGALGTTEDGARPTNRATRRAGTTGPSKRRTAAKPSPRR